MEDFDLPPHPQRARDFAIAAHGFQSYGGRPYAFHLDQVAAKVRERGRLFETIAYLHDVLEDTGVDRGDIERVFGPQVARCVATISDPENRTREERKALINRQLAAVKESGPEWPALVVKVADRLCNIAMCEVDDRADLLARYAKEHPDFRAAAWRPAFRDSFAQMETVLSRHAGGGDGRESTDPASPTVPRFVAEFTENWELYQVLARETAGRCEAALMGHGLQAIVSSRAKSPERLQRKLLRRQSERGQVYASATKIFEDIVDLAGVRVALYFPGDAQVFDALLRRNFEVIGTKVHEGDQTSMGDYGPRFSGYWARHYRVRGEAGGRQVIVEIQVASVLMHAFAHVAHDLTYKPAAGQLSWTEYALLDQLNGLVLAGEMALEQLHKAMRARMRRHDAPLADHFELGAWLTRWARLNDRDESTLGRVDRLFELLREIERTRPSQIEPLLRDIGHGGAVANRLVERLLLERPERAAQWSAALSAVDATNPYEVLEPMQAAEIDIVRQLLSEWTELESAAAKRLTGKRRRSFPIGKKRLASLDFTPAQLQGFADANAVYRDVARHGGRFDLEAQQAAVATIKHLRRELEAQAPRG